MSTNDKAIGLLAELVAWYGEVNNADYLRILEKARRFLARNAKDVLAAEKQKVREANEE